MTKVPPTPSYTPQPVADAAAVRDRLRYCGDQGWAIVIEHTDDASPQNHYWERWGLPLLDEPDLVLFEIEACRRRYPADYIRLVAYGSGSARSLIQDTILVHAPPK